jgi:hypothetical protein
VALQDLSRLELQLLPPSLIKQMSSYLRSLGERISGFINGDTKPM